MGATTAGGAVDATTGAGAAVALTAGFAGIGIARAALREGVRSLPLRRCPYLPERQARSQIHELSRNTSSSSVRYTASPETDCPEAVLARYSMQMSFPVASALETCTSAVSLRLSRARKARFRAMATS